MKAYSSRILDVDGCRLPRVASPLLAGRSTLPSGPRRVLSHAAAVAPELPAVSRSSGRVAPVFAGALTDASDGVLPVHELTPEQERADSNRTATTSSSSSARQDERQIRRSRKSVEEQGMRGSGRSSGGANGGEGTSKGAKAGGGGRRSGAFNAREFTTELANAATVSELELLFEYGKSQKGLNEIHLATAWSRLAKLMAEQDKRPAAAAPAARARSKAAASAGPSSPAPAAPSSESPSAVSDRVLLAFVEALEGATGPEQLGAMAPRGLSTVVWAAARLKPAAAEPAATSASSGHGAAGSGSHELPAAHEQGAAGHGSAGQEAQGQGEAVVGEGERPRPLRIRGGKTALAKAAAAAAKAEAAAAAADGGGRLAGSLVSVRLLDAWASAAGRQLAGFSMQDLSNSVWALGRLGYMPEGMFMTQITVALLKELPRADRPQQLSNVLLGLALLRWCPPVKDFWPAVWVAMQRLVLEEQRTPDVQAISNSLWALSQLVASCPGTMPPVPSNLVSRAVFRAVQWGDRATPTQVQDVLTSLPRLGFEPSEYQASKLLSLTRRVLPSADGQALSTLLMALLQMRVRPTAGWMRQMLGGFARQLPTPACTPEAVARVLYCASQLRWRLPPALLQQMWSKLRSEAHRCAAPDVAFAALAVKRLFPQLGPGAAGEQQQQQAGKEQEQEEDGAGEGGEGEQAAAAEGSRARALPPPPPPPPREVLVALRDAWEAAGPAGQLGVVFAIRAEVTEFFEAALGGEGEQVAEGQEQVQVQHA